MNSDQTHKRSNLTREDIEQYRSTQDESIRHGIEKKAMNDDFDNDALDGWNDPQMTGVSMKRLDERFKPSSGLIYWIIGSVALLVIGIALYTGTAPKGDAKHNQPVPTASVTIEKTDIVLPERIEAMQELPSKQQIKAKTIIEDYSVQQKNETENKPEHPTVQIEDLPIKKIEEAKPETTIARETLLGKEIYLSDLKLLDYRAYRSRPKIATKQMVLTGTPANVGETTTNEEQPEWKDVDVPYIDYLEKTMELFSKGQNKKALARFQVILETYPDDLNANFYAGLCYYNLKQFSEAGSSFEKCLVSKYINFNEEAEWYLAKSLQANGKESESKELFRKIANGNGYYAKQAEKLLK